MKQVLRLLLILMLSLSFVGGADNAALPTTVTDLKDAWVKLYDDVGKADRCLTILSPTSKPHAIYQRGDIPNFKAVASDDKKGGDFGDKTSAVQFCIPVGWSLVLFANADWKGDSLTLIGTGKVVDWPDINKQKKGFSDEASSARWTPVASK